MPVPPTALPAAVNSITPRIKAAIRPSPGRIASRVARRDIRTCAERSAGRRGFRLLLELLFFDETLDAIQALFVLHYFGNHKTGQRDGQNARQWKWRLQEADYVAHARTRASRRRFEVERLNHDQAVAFGAAGEIVEGPPVQHRFYGEAPAVRAVVAGAHPGSPARRVGSRPPGMPAPQGALAGIVDPFPHDRRRGRIFSHENQVSLLGPDDFAPRSAQHLAAGTEIEAA